MMDADEVIDLASRNPIIMAEWLDEKRRTASGPPNTWKYMRVKFKNGGQSAVITAETVDEIGERWLSLWGLDEPDENEVFCPACPSSNCEEMGSLGRLLWYRCRDCGTNFNNEDIGSTGVSHVDHGGDQCLST